MTPQQIIFLSIVGIALVALIFLSESQKRYNLDSIKRKTVGDGQYGTARWATQEEIQSSIIQVPYEPEAWRYNKESRPTTAGIVVNLKQNKKQILATIDPSDSHTLMVAGTGGGKTTTFMIPNIEYALACGTSFISTDSKGDLLRLYGKLCEQYGYTCLNINFRTPMKSDSYNYMQLINLYIDMWRDDPKRVDYHSRAERYAKALANSIVHTKGFDGGGQNSYFYDSSEGLITSIILLVAQYCKPEERHIVSVFKILLEFVQTVKSANDETDSQRKVKQTKLNEILSLLPEDDKIRWFAGSVPGSEGMQYLSVITTSMSRLLAFIDSESENILCKNSKITVADIYQKKVAVFITFPEEDATKHVLVSLFLSQIINEAIVYADERTKENKLTRRLYIFADEFGIFPYMGNILGMFGASRSRNIIIVPCIQSPAQLRQTYGADGETIIRDCCQTVIFGGFSPMSDTAVTFSKLLGNQTVAAGSVSTNNREGRSLFGSGSNSSRSVNMIARPLMTPDELQLLPFGKWVVNRRGSHPFIANMPRYDKWGIRLEAPYISETREYVPTAYAKLDDVIRTIKEEKWRQTVQEKRESANSSESVGSTADY